MIIDTPDTDASATNVDSSDAASTNTLVNHEQNIPKRLIYAIFLSVIIATLAFSFTIVNNVDGSVAAILAFVFTLLHHAATILLKWLQHHDMASILPFSPFSAPAIGYSIAFLIMWIASTAIAAATNVSNTATATVATSAIELALISYITFVCFFTGINNTKDLARRSYPLTASPP